MSPSIVLPSPMGISVISPTHVTFGAGAVKSRFTRSGNGTARLSGRVRFLPAGVTVDSFAWIGSSGVRTGPAAGLRVAATDEYRRLEAELPGLPVTWSGSLSWRAADSAPEAGPGQKIIDAATVATLEPNLRQPPDWAVWASGDALPVPRPGRSGPHGSQHPGL